MKRTVTVNGLLTPAVKKSLAGIAAVAALASVVAGRERPSVEVIAPAARIDTRIQVPDELDLAKLGERTEGDGAATKGKNPFAPRNFAPIEPPQKQVVRKEKPTAPPLPF